MKQLPTPSRTFSTFTALLLGIAFIPFSLSAQAKHEKLTTAAWDAFNAKNYEEAITNAEECIADFGIAAGDLQEKVAKAGKEIPTGAVSDELKRQIFANGPLNDVATCYFIIGEANRPFARTDVAKLRAAKTAYEEARKLTFGRCWDTNGWFWSPAEVAGQRLRVLPVIPTN